MCRGIELLVMIYGNTDHWPVEMYPTMLHAIGPEATAHDEATRFRYRHQHSLSGEMGLSQALQLEILFPDEGIKCK